MKLLYHICLKLPYTPPKFPAGGLPDKKNCKILISLSPPAGDLGGEKVNAPKNLKYFELKLFKCFFLCLATVSSIAAFTIDEWKAVQSSETLSVYLNNQSIGQMVTSLTVKNARISLSSTMNIEVSAGGAQKVASTIHESRQYDSSGNLVSANQEMSSPAGKNYWSLEKNSEWNLKVTTGGIENKRVIKDVKDRIASTYLLYRGMMNASIKIGDSWNDTTLELTSGENVFMQTRCAAVPDAQNGNTWKFIEHNSVNDKDDEWILDSRGITISRGIFPFVARRKGHAGKDTGSVNIFECFKIPMSRSANDSESVVVIGDDHFTMDSSVSSYYRCKDGRYLLDRPHGNCLSNVSFKIPDSLKVYLEATATMQINDPGIRGLAARFNNKGSVCERISSMNEYVFTSLKKVYTATFSSAVETYKAGFGDCGEHAVLLAALLRASGIPSRVVSGLVYMPARKGYFYHAWVMVYTGNSWIFTDPALGVFPANYDRVPLVIDDTGEKVIALARVIGRLKIDYGRK